MKSGIKAIVGIVAANSPLPVVQMVGSEVACNPLPQVHYTHDTNCVATECGAAQYDKPIIDESERHQRNIERRNTME